MPDFEDQAQAQERRVRANEAMVDQAIDVLAGRIVIADISKGELGESPLTARPRVRTELAHMIAEYRRGRVRIEQSRSDDGRGTEG